MKNKIRLFLAECIYYLSVKQFYLCFECNKIHSIKNKSFALGKNNSVRVSNECAEKMYAETTKLFAKAFVDRINNNAK